MTCAAALLCPPGVAFAQEAPSPDPDPWFGPDKALHFGAGFGIGVGGYALGAGVLDERWAGVGLGLGLTMLIGGVKEGIDAAGAGQPSWKDFVWDVLGGGVGRGREHHLRRSASWSERGVSPLRGLDARGRTPS